MQHDTLVKRHYGTFVNPNYENFRWERKSQLLEQLYAIDDTGGPDIRGGFGQHYKGGGGGGKGVVGAVVGIVATVVSAGTLAPALAGTMFAANTAGFAIASGAIAGAVGGLASGLVTGQNIGKSMLMGGAMGGISGGVGYSQGWTTGSAANPEFMPGGAQAAAPVEAGATVSGTPTGGESSWSSNTFNGTVDTAAVGGAPESSIASQLDSGAAATPQAGLDAPTAPATQAGEGSWSSNTYNGTVDSAATQQAGLTPSGFNADGSIINNAQQGQPGYGWKYYPDGTSISDNGSYFKAGERITGANAGPIGLTDRMSDLSGSIAAKTDGIFTGEGMKKAGLQLGTQAVAGALFPNKGAAQMESYLNDMKQMQGQANAFNMEMANKKAGVGDTLQQQASNINPEYYGLQNYNSTRNRRNSAWQDQEATLRAQGYDQNYINSMKNKFDVDTSTSAGTAYDSGWQTGNNARTQTYGAAGNMYGSVPVPTAGLQGMYSQLYGNGNENAKKAADTMNTALGTNSADNTKKPA